MALFRYLAAGLCAGLLARLGGDVWMLLGLVLALPPKLLPARPRVLESLTIMVGLFAGLLLAGPIEEGDPASGRIKGVWRFTAVAKGGMFSGRLAGGGDLLIRGSGRRLPIPGDEFTAHGLYLESSVFRSPEFRLQSWESEVGENHLQRQSRLGRLEGRSRILFPLTGSYQDRQRPLARALLFGDKRGLPSRAKRAFRDAGLAHLLALSGLHVGLFLLLLRRLLTPMTARPSRAECLLLLVLPFLPAWGGGGASINRASFMAGYLLLGRRMGGRPLGIEALAFAACMEIMRRPASLFEPGFQLSYLATLALLAFPGRRARLDARWMGRSIHYLREGFNISTLCTLALLPVILVRFDHLPLGGSFWNLLAAPLTAASLFTGWTLLPFGLLPGSTLIPDFAFARLLDLGTLAGSQWRLLLTGFEVPGWAWLPWGWGMRGILVSRRLRSWILAMTPAAVGWIQGKGGFEWGPPPF